MSERRFLAAWICAIALAVVTLGVLKAQVGGSGVSYLPPTAANLGKILGCTGGQLIYAGASKALTCSNSLTYDATGTLALATNDVKWTGTINSQPMYFIVDGGTTGALSGFGATSGAASNDTGFFYCTGPASTLGAGLTGGPTGGFCQLTTGDILFGNAGNVPLVFGANGNYAGQIFPADRGWNIGSPTGGDKGTGSLNAVSLYSNGSQLLPALTGTTASLGGSALTAGQCTTGTVAVTNSTTAMAVAVSPVADPGTSVTWEGFVSTAGTVTVRICALIALTPTATTYNVRVLQ